MTKKQENYSFYETIMIDIHSHILPGIDDGAADLNTSLAMADIAVADGIQVVIATPHVDGTGHLSPAMINTAVDRLNSVLRQRGVSLVVFPGAELQSHVAIELVDQYCLASGSFFLLEFPHSHLPADALDLIYTLVQKGFTPIIAHPERNREISMEPGKLSSLVGAGARVQITAGSLTGELGANALTCARFLLKMDMVHFMATDSHSPNFRKPILSKAVKKAKKYLGREGALALVRDNPLAILPEGYPLH